MTNTQVLFALYTLNRRKHYLENCFERWFGSNESWDCCY